MLADFLRIMLEIINCILATGLARNPELVYALLHKQEMFAALRQQPRLVELVDNIQVRRVLTSMQILLSHGGQGWGLGADLRAL